jgi:hypothetical protein
MQGIKFSYQCTEKEEQARQYSEQVKFFISATQLGFDIVKSV